MKEDFQVNLFKALAHPTRLKIIKRLWQGEQCVCHLNEDIEFSQANISQHLKILKEARIVSSNKKGLYQYYQIRNDKIKNMIELAEHIFSDEG